MSIHDTPWPPPSVRRRPDITLDAVHQRRCPLLRYAYDMQELRRSGIHMDEVDVYLDYLWAYDQRARMRKLKDARRNAQDAQLLADLAQFHADYPVAPTPTASQATHRDGIRPRPPRRYPPRIPHLRSA